MPDARASLEHMRERTRSRNAPLHDWRLTLLPAVIEAGMPPTAVRLCKALCDHQRGRSFYPEVIVGLRELEAELDTDHSNVVRANRRLVKEGLLVVTSGGGRLAGSRKGRANVYQLGPRLAVAVAAFTVSTPTPLRVSTVTPYTGRSHSRYGVNGDTPHPSGYLRNPSGDRGEDGRPAVGTTTANPDAQHVDKPVSTSRLKDLLERFSHERTIGATAAP